jgi:hypothetical protein
MPPKTTLTVREHFTLQLSDEMVEQAREFVRRVLAGEPNFFVWDLRTRNCLGEFSQFDEAEACMEEHLISAGRWRPWRKRQRLAILDLHGKRYA